MPTENRSSNTEMVSVPRNLLSRWLMDFGRTHAALNELKADTRAILAQQAQHQGEPVAMPARKSYEESFSVHGQGQIMGWNACLDEIAKLGPLYTHVDPGEVERIRAQHEKLWSDFVRVDDENETLRIGMKGDYDLDAWLAFVKERETLRAQLAERDALLGDFIKMAREPESGMRNDCLRIDAVRAEKVLAGDEPEGVTECLEFDSAINHQRAFKLSSSTIAAAKWGWSSGRAALSASAEPAMPQYFRQALGIDDEVRERLTLIAREAAISSPHRYSYMPALPKDAQFWQPHAWVIEAMRMVEKGVPDCRYCGDTGQIMVGRSGDASDGNAPIMEPCEDCERGAQVERDERTAFVEAWNKRGIDPVEAILIPSLTDDSFANVRARDAYWGWQARAALERKP